MEKNLDDYDAESNIDDYEPWDEEKDEIMRRLVERDEEKTIFSTAESSALEEHGVSIFWP
jgi:hypothetical protein